MTVFDVVNNSVAMVDWHSPHAKRQVMENIQRFVDAYVQEKVEDARLDEAEIAYYSWKDSHEDFGANQAKMIAKMKAANHAKVTPADPPKEK